MHGEWGQREPDCDTDLCRSKAASLYLAMHALVLLLCLLPESTAAT